MSFDFLVLDDAWVIRLARRRWAGRPEDLMQVRAAAVPAADSARTGPGGSGRCQGSSSADSFAIIALRVSRLGQRQLVVEMLWRAARQIGSAASTWLWPSRSAAPRLGGRFVAAHLAHDQSVAFPAGAARARLAVRSMPYEIGDVRGILASLFLGHGDQHATPPPRRGPGLRFFQKSSPRNPGGAGFVLHPSLENCAPCGWIWCPAVAAVCLLSFFRCRPSWSLRAYRAIVFIIVHVDSTLNPRGGGKIFFFFERKNPWVPIFFPPKKKGLEQMPHEAVGLLCRQGWTLFGLSPKLGLCLGRRI